MQDRGPWHAFDMKLFDDRLAVGVNFWHAPWIAASRPTDPRRLPRELDRLRDHGIHWIRVFACSEGPGDHPRRVRRALQPRPGVYDEALLLGLDRVLAELGSRHMRAVIVLTNFWDWSGGLGQYRAWGGAGALPDPAVQGWSALQRYVSGFYRDRGARAAFVRHVERIVGRRSALSGLPYTEEPALGMWQIANEPRGIGDPRGMRAWIADVAGRIVSHDPAHPISVGSEGSTTDPQGAGLDFLADHAHEAIGCTTCHLWPENWGRYDPLRCDERSFEAVLGWARGYLRAHAELAAQLGKPLWLEELGLARDGRRLDPASPTTRRDRFLAAVIDEAHRLRGEGLPVAGVMPWAWSGEGLSDPAQTPSGDPPHEPHGWYGIGSEDHSTLSVLRGTEGATRSRSPTHTP